ncbi:MAG: hypothetical protein P4L11_15180 [Geothrix sp.]|nr:hypothetical protein [Geothrix sp.]
MSRCRRFAQLLPILVASLGAMALPPALRAQPAPVANPDPKGLLGRAHAAYYNLSARGFKQYRFQANPDWAYLLGDLAKTNPAAFSSAMAIFAKVRFDVVVDVNGTAKVSHNNVETPNEQARAGMNQVYDGMDQMLTGFFQTWHPFMLQTPFSSPGRALNLEESGDRIRVRWVEEENVKVDILMDRTYAVTEMKINSPGFDSAIYPAFDRQPGGLVLASYEADYQDKSGGPKIHVKVLIRNRPLQGLVLPSDLDLTAQIGESNTHILVAFTEASLERVPPVGP